MKLRSPFEFRKTEQIVEKADPPDSLVWTPTVQFYPASIPSWDNQAMTAEMLYRNQSAYSACCDFLGKTLARPSMKLWQRTSADKRQQLYNHPMQDLLLHPSKTRPPIDFWRSVYTDAAIFDRTFTLVTRFPDRIYLERLVPTQIFLASGSWSTPYSFRVLYQAGAQFGGFSKEIPALQVDKPLAVGEQAIWFCHGYAPDRAIDGVSSAIKLASILQAEDAAMHHQENSYRKGLRVGSVVEFPQNAEVDELGPEGRRVVREDMRQLYTGTTDEAIMILENGGHLNEVPNPSLQDMEWMAARQLTRAEVARAFQIPLVLLNLQDGNGATYASAYEGRAALITDALLPWLDWMQSNIEFALFGQFIDLDDRVDYVEATIEEFLRGDFNKTAVTLNAAVGGPYVMPSEARAKMGLEFEPGTDFFYPSPTTPGASPIPQPTETPVDNAGKAQLLVEKASPVDPAQVEEFTNFFSAYFTRQRDALGIGKVEKADGFPNRSRWDKELAVELQTLKLNAATAAAKKVKNKYGGGNFDPSRIEPYVTKASENEAIAINDVTESDIKAAESPKALSALFAGYIVERAVQLANTNVAGMTNFGSQEGAFQGGARTKTWEWSGVGPRHEDMGGETVGINEEFSNGCSYPGSCVDVGDTVNCQCTVSFGTA